MIDLTDIIKAIILLIMAIVSGFLIPMLKRKLSDDKFYDLVNWVRVAVQAAEMIFTESGMGEKKKDYVIDFIQTKGYTVDLYELDALIESEVLKLQESYTKPN